MRIVCDINQHGIESVRFWTGIETVTWCRPDRSPDRGASGDPGAFGIVTMG